ncbi:hypothetical protein M422DRAFT_181315 [Sphaerobolus stellatus SS14]|uniref:Major facilitator superfamily (MFS) profile domain-containing protein n=1 Tax=Sphaerobolus stellatus (strain SS14) TaxID=990650 RepID=A0A0C9UJK6_SPHS4|nr:hypothetical protein M422DRAFT_181315 [Sphaerobolus stellatus SS14]
MDPNVHGSNSLSSLGPQSSQQTAQEDKKEDIITVSQEEIKPIDGGVAGWLSVAGSWLILFSSMGYIYSFGVYQDYYTRIFLPNQNPSSIAWMGSFQLALPFMGGLVVGKLFDSGHTRVIFSHFHLHSLFMLSLAKPMKYYQVFLSQGLGMGLGAACLFMPATTVISLRFRRRRSWATGVALTGISFGAVVYPILLNHLIFRIGFGNAVRASAYISLGCLLSGNVLIQPVLRPRGGGTGPNIKTFFKDVAYLTIYASFSTVLALLGVYFPVIYLQLYAITHGLDNTLAFYSLAIVNGSGILGRLIGNYLADIYGLWNIQAPITFATGGLIWAMLGMYGTGSLIAVSILYGITSGAWLSLTTAGVASLAASPQEVGYVRHLPHARVGIAFAIISSGPLLSAPVQGALLSSSFQWIRPVAFSGVRK